LEAEQLKSRQEDYLREKEFFRRVIKQAEEHIGVLSESLKNEEAGVQADMQDLHRVTDLFGKGAVAITRITDARRALLWSSTLKLQTTAQWMSQKKQREEVSRQLERLHDQRRMDLLRELQDAGVRLSQISARLQGVGEKLQYTALVRSQLVRGSGGKPQITIIREGESGRERLVAEEDFELEPGDVVEGALRAEQGVVLPPQ
jgi:polysaccharide export outer membrane protein